MTTSSTEEEAMSPCTSRRMVEDVFLDFQGRRLAILKARTTEFKSFYEQCDPRKENLCLFGLASEQWKVDLPSEEVPQEMPEPSLGVNFARDGKDVKDWLANVAVHSDAWLISVAFYFGARFHFDKNERKRLFNMINELPTILEVVTGTAKKQVKNKATNSNHGSNKPKSNSKRGSESMGKHAKVSRARELREDYEDGTEDTEDENGLALCGACGTNYDPGEFWIMCDVCDRWFHGQCVKVTPAMAERIKQYICPSCSNKRSRP